MVSRGFPPIEMLQVMLVASLAAAPAFFRPQSHLTRIAAITSPPTSVMRLDHAFCSQDSTSPDERRRAAGLVATGSTRVTA